MKKSGSTGEEEREFSMIKETKVTGSGHANHMIQNSFIRIQAENLIPERSTKQ